MSLSEKNVIHVKLEPQMSGIRLLKETWKLIFFGAIAVRLIWWFYVMPHGAGQ